MNFLAKCPVCDEEKEFETADDYWSCRDGLRSLSCNLNGCVTRERAVAKVVFSIWSKAELTTLSIHECAPIPRGLTLWMMQNCANFVPTGFFPAFPRGSVVNQTRNENLLDQTFVDQTFDLVIHLDVLEHLFDPYAALNEIYRTLKPGGYCIFTAPTEGHIVESVQVAFDEGGMVTTVGTPEYHGNPQNPEEGSLVTFRYGHDLPLQIFRRTHFRNIEHRRFMDQHSATMGYMSDVYILQR